MDSNLREAYEPRVWDSNPSPACAKPVSVDALFPSAGKWFLEAETRPSQAGPRGRHFGLSGRAFSLPAGNPPEMTAILRRSGCASNSGRIVGGAGRTRTYEGLASGFTVRPICRSGHSPLRPRRLASLDENASGRPRPGAQVRSRRPVILPLFCSGPWLDRLTHCKDDAEPTPENAAAFLAHLVAEFPQRIIAVSTNIHPAFAEHPCSALRAPQ